MWVSEIPETKKAESRQLHQEYLDWVSKPGNEVKTYPSGMSSGVVDEIEAARYRNRRTRKLYEEYEDGDDE